MVGSNEELRATTEWRWVDERGRAMTNWKQGDPPPIGEVSDAKGTMRVEVRAIAALAPAQEPAGGGEVLRHSCDLDMLSACPACAADLATPTPQAAGVSGLTLPYEQALSALIDLIVPDLDSGNILADAHTAMKALNERAAELTTTYVQHVPDKCDRIIWRGRYFRLPETLDGDVAAAGAAPEGWVLVPETMQLTPEALDLLVFTCGGVDRDSKEADERWCGGVLWVGEVKGDDGAATYGLHVNNADYPEEGSNTLVEFAATPAPQAAPASGGEVRVLTDSERIAITAMLANAKHDAGDVEDAPLSIETDEDAHWAYHAYHGLTKLLAASPQPGAQEQSNG